jgi:hypothetical protein
MIGETPLPNSTISGNGNASVRKSGQTPALALRFVCLTRGRVARMPPALRRGGGGGARLRLWFKRTRGVPRPQRRIGCPADAGKRRRHRGEVAEGEEGDVIPDLLLKNLDATLATYV